MAKKDKNNFFNKEIKITYKELLLEKVMILPLCFTIIFYLNYEKIYNLLSRFLKLYDNGVKVIYVCGIVFLLIIIIGLIITLSDIVIYEFQKRNKSNKN